uniref:Uncharacterized protein n=1 Tax=Anguilla anguilla TaxID=7936 RepID=A0A0E9RCJ2_ANGAN
MTSSKSLNPQLRMRFQLPAVFSVDKNFSGTLLKNIRAQAWLIDAAILQVIAGTLPLYP